MKTARTIGCHWAAISCHAATVSAAVSQLRLEGAGGGLEDSSHGPFYLSLLDARQGGEGSESKASGVGREQDLALGPPTPSALPPYPSMMPFTDLSPVESVSPSGPQKRGLCPALCTPTCHAVTPLHFSP